MARGELRSGGRLPLLAVLLIASLALAAVLALQAITTARRHRQAAERALHDYADFAAFTLASHAYRQLGGAIVQTFAGWPEAQIPEGARCAVSRTRFDQASPGALRFGGDTLPAAEQAMLRDTLQSAMTLLAEAGWRFRFIGLRSAVIDGVAIASYRTGPQSWGLRGFTVCLGGEPSLLGRVVAGERALPPAMTGDLPADSLLAVRVSAGSDSAVFTSLRLGAYRYTGSARLGTEFGDMTLHASLRPEVAERLVIGGVPRSPTLLAIALLALSTLLVVAALVQLRREYELIAMRSRFVANVSHELRTPLSQILLFTELLKLGKLRSDAERERALDIVDQEARRLIRLIENVLRFSRGGAGRQRLDHEVLPLALVVRETLDAFRPLAAARDVELRADIPKTAAVRADRSALRQILLNLLDNAVKYGPRGQVVTVAAQIENGRTRLAVEDQGPGIPHDDRERVWDGFFRLEREDASAIAGSGIGLSVVRSLAADMGGRAWNEEAPGGGARFVIELASAEAEP